MTEFDFIQEIQDEITGSGSLPIVLEEREIKRIIRQAKSYFHENYSVAAETHYYVIKRNEFNNDEFRKNRTIQMPDCVVSVYEVREINGLGRLGNLDRDFAEDKLLASEIFLSSSSIGDDLVQRVAQYQMFDLSKAFFLSNISYDFNRNTKKITILGRDPKFDVFIKTYIKIPDDRIYDDYYFLRYCTAKAKISLARIIGLYPFPLPGGVEINVDMLREEGTEEVNWVLEQITGENTPDYFLMFH